MESFRQWHLTYLGRGGEFKFKVYSRLVTSFRSSCTCSSPERFCSSLFSRDATFSCKSVMSFSFSWVSAVTCRWKQRLCYLLSPSLTISPRIIMFLWNSVSNCILGEHIAKKSSLKMKQKRYKVRTQHHLGVRVRPSAVSSKCSQFKRLTTGKEGCFCLCGI